MNSIAFAGTKHQLTLVEQSYGKCLVKGDLIGRFYEVFFSASSEVNELFSHVDIDKQKKVLRHGILCLILFAKGSFSGQVTLEKIAITHKRDRMNIKPELYPIWKKSLLTVVEEYEDDFSDELKQSWKMVLDHGVDFIIDGYLK